LGPAIALNRVLLPLFGWPRNMTVGISLPIENYVHHDLRGNAAAEGDAGVRCQIPDEQGAPEDPPGIDLDQVILVKPQGEQSAADSFPALDVDDPQRAPVGSLGQLDHILIFQTYE
jgi:hypothetical protein